MSALQLQVIQALEKHLLNETIREIGLEAKQLLDRAIEAVDLEIEYSPVLFPRSLAPCTAVRLGNGKFAIYDAPHGYANLGNHYWNVPTALIKEFRARFLLQRDRFYNDLIYYNHLKENNPEVGFWFFTWDGIPVHRIPRLVIDRVIPAFLGELLIPSPSNPIAQKIVQAREIENYVSADGTIDVKFSGEA